MGANFRESPKSLAKLIFMILKFVTATSQGAWHCTRNDVINTYTCLILLTIILSHTYRDLGKIA